MLYRLYPFILMLAGCQIATGSSALEDIEETKDEGPLDEDASDESKTPAEDCPLGRCMLSESELNERDDQLSEEYGVPPGVVGIPEDLAELFPDEAIAEAHDGDGYCLGYSLENGYYYFECDDDFPDGSSRPEPADGEDPVDSGRGIPPGTCWPACFDRDIPLSFPGEEDNPAPPQGFCGDGIIDENEQCDDGNNLPGDGCGSTCGIEVIAEEPESGCDSSQRSTEMLEVTYRDFRAYNRPDGHPDFEAQVCGLREGAVLEHLDDDGKPVLSDTAPAVCFAGQEAFSQWYRDVDGVNMTFLETIQLTADAIDSEKFVFSSNNFFPLTGRGYGDTNGKNYHFTTEIGTDFEFRGNEVLTFRGDDDVWVFINGRLALDIGGIHGAITRTLTLGAAETRNGNAYNAYFDMEVGDIVAIHIFHAERHLTQSNFMLELYGYNLCR